MRFGFFVREALRGLGRNSAPALAALLTVVLTALVLGVFIPIVQATTGTADSVRNRVVVEVYLKDGSTAAERQDVRSAIERTSNVKSVTFVSKAQGLAEAKKKNPEAFSQGTALLGGNPLPDAFRVVPKDPGQVGAIVNRLAPRDAQGQRVPSLAGIDEVRNKESDTQKILSATSLVKVLTAGLAALLVFASIALIANTIRLSIFARRREVEVMKLVGATNWFIRWPFVLEGALVGLMGGVIAILLLLVAKVTFVDPIEQRFALLASPNTIDFGVLIAILMVCCVGVSSLGSAVTLRRFLRV